MAFGLSGIDNISNLFNMSFGTGGISSLLGSLTGAGGLSSLASINLQQAGQSYLNSISNQQSFNRTELSLRNAASKLNSANSSSSFNQNTAVSSNSLAVSATTLSNATAGTYKVEVSQLAKSQKLQGAGLEAGAASQITTNGGFGQFEINMKGKSELVTYQLTDGETNKEAMAKMAEAINARNLGVTASVATTTVSGVTQARLNLEGPTGAENNFTVTATVGNGADITGLSNAGNITQTAQNAKFTVNGASFESATNEYTMTNAGIKLSLNNTTGATAATIAVQAGGDTLETDVRDFVEQYNKTLEKLKYDTASYSQTSASNLQSIASMNAGALSKAGIEVGPGGYLKINETNFQNALANNPAAVKSAFNGAGGFAANVQAETERAINQSLSGSTAGLSGGFGSLFSGFSTFGYGLNMSIASNIGLFFSSLY